MPCQKTGPARINQRIDLVYVGHNVVIWRHVFRYLKYTRKPGHQAPKFTAITRPVSVLSHKPSGTPSSPETPCPVPLDQRVYAQRPSFYSPRSTPNIH